MLTRATGIAGTSSLIFGTEDTAVFSRPGRAGTTCTRALLDVVLPRRPTSVGLDLAAVADRVTEALAHHGLPAPVLSLTPAQARYASGRHRDQGPAALALFRTLVDDPPHPTDLRRIDALAAAAAEAESARTGPLSSPRRRRGSGCRGGAPAAAPRRGR